VAEWFSGRRLTCRGQVIEADRVLKTELQAFALVQSV